MWRPMAHVRNQGRSTTYTRYIRQRRVLSRTMLIITLGARIPTKEADDSFLPRTHCGWDHSLTEEQIYDAGRGWWRMAAGAEGERLALVVGGGVVRIAVAIEIWEVRGDERRAFAGRILAKGDLAHDRFVGKPDPSGSTSRNPARYWMGKNLPAQYTACLCGCGVEVRNRWLPGHDQRAIHDRIRRDFGGNVGEFVVWYDLAKEVGGPGRLAQTGRR
jgi:hypothetical protein